jgi:hypothetical protein
MLPLCNDDFTAGGTRSRVAEVMSRRRNLSIKL